LTLRVPALRESFNGFVERHDVAWELTMAALAVLFVVTGFAADDASGEWRPRLELLDLFLTGVFVAEFTSRFAASYDRRSYLRGHWIDLVALIPAARIGRLGRLLRLLRLVRAFSGVHRAAVHVGRLAHHRGLAWLVSAWLGVAVICSMALYVAENGVNKMVTSPVDALWWGIVTLTTVGYGDVYPVTAEGRVAAMILMLLGIGLFSAITATVTSFLLSTRQPLRQDDPGAALRTIGDLHVAGLLTDDEFQTKKAELLARI
jgi:voltage-gated potassium channel